MNIAFKLTGKLRIVVTGPDGELKHEWEGPNLVVISGTVFVASRMVGTSQNVMSHMAIGTSNTSPNPSDTGLIGELVRVAFDSAMQTSNTVTYVATYPPGTGTGAIQEAGIFNNVSGGTMLCRTTFSVINKGVNDSMTISWTVTAG